jgi:hypothetical protein
MCLLYVLQCELFWRKFHGLLRRMNVYYIALGWNSLEMSVKFIWFMFQFNSEVSFFFFLFFFFYLVIDESWVLTSPTLGIPVLFISLCPVVFLWCNWTHQCRMHMHLQLLCLPDRLFPLLICSYLFSVFSFILIGSHCIMQTGFKSVKLLPLPPEC